MRSLSKSNKEVLYAILSVSLGWYKLDLKKIAEKTNSYNAGSIKATVGKGVYLTVGISSGYTAGHWIGTGQKIFALYHDDVGHNETHAGNVRVDIFLQIVKNDSTEISMSCSDGANYFKTQAEIWKIF